MGADNYLPPRESVPMPGTMGFAARPGRYMLPGTEQHWTDGVLPNMPQGAAESAMRSALHQVLDDCKQQKLDPAGCMAKSEGKIQDLVKGADASFDEQFKAAKAALGDDKLQAAVRDVTANNAMMQTALDRFSQDHPDQVEFAGALIGLYSRPETKDQLKKDIEDQLKTLGLLDPLKAVEASSETPDFKRAMEQQAKFGGASTDLMTAHMAYGRMLGMVGRFDDSAKQQNIVNGFSTRLRELQGQ